MNHTDGLDMIARVDSRIRVLCSNSRCVLIRFLFISAAGDVPGVVPSKGPNYVSTRVGAGKGGATDISWSAAYPLITGWLIKHYNNVRMAERHWPTLVLFMENLLTLAANSTPFPRQLSLNP